VGPAERERQLEDERIAQSNAREVHGRYAWPGHRSHYSFRKERRRAARRSPPGPGTEAYV